MADKSAFSFAATIGGAILVAFAAGGALAARRRFMIIDVIGDSMNPSLIHGDRLLVRRTRRLRVGNIVIAHHQEDGRRPAIESQGSTWLVKRLAAMPGDAVPEPVALAGSQHVPAGMTVLLGEHPESVDSRRWGFVPLDDIEGVAIRRLRFMPR
ncbi:MAG TPA: S26 family signal peptidase [Kineosporiaceae bacterium]|nr:S26 family signal peptidase [Kineosporiaceae bacterium]